MTSVNMVPHLDDEAAKRSKRARQQRNLNASIDAKPSSTLESTAKLPSQLGSSPPPKYAGKGSSMQWANNERVWLRVHGSLPCRHEAVSATCRKLQEMAISEMGGKISFAVVDDGNNSFDCDRRTFEPHCFMISFSPKPIIPIPIVFWGLSTRIG
jgi:hypothetical protein